MYSQGLDKEVYARSDHLLGEVQTKQRKLKKEKEKKNINKNCGYEQKKKHHYTVRNWFLFLLHF